MKKITQVIIVQNEEVQKSKEEKVLAHNTAIYDVAVYDDGILDFYVKDDDKQNLSNAEVELTNYYKEKDLKFPYEVENMYIGKDSVFWNSSYGKEDKVPNNLLELKQIMDQNGDIIEGLDKEEFSKVIF